MADLSLKTAITERGRLDGVSPSWTPHPKFPGVELCRLVEHGDSDGAFSTLLVSLEGGAAMEPHRHEGETEQHIVLEGAGVLDLDGTSHAYHPGQVAIIPRGHLHAVVAGKSGLVLLAIFSPAPQQDAAHRDLRALDG